MKGPVVVGANTNLLSLAEVAILTRGPKFTVRRILCKERFLLEMEKCFVKLRWALKDKGLLDEVDFETMLTDEERKKIDELAEVEEAMTKSVFNHDDLVVDFRKLKATDVKHNTKIVLPGPLTNQQEGELQMRRIAWGKVFDDFVAKFSDEDNVKDDNLTKEEKEGLKSLKQRVKDGSIVICSTDKSSRFAVMSLEEYEEAGRKHTDKDQEIDMDVVKAIEHQLNGHMSMILKIFNVGANWGHEDRVRATKIIHSLSVAPLYLLYKDHKGWTLEMGGAPPSRPVASAGSGQNDHFSENVSQMLEPVANTWKGGMESSSTPDMVSKIKELNDGDLELEDINLSEVDMALDELERRRNEETETIECDTLTSPGLVNVPVEIPQNTAKLELMAADCATKINNLKLRWENENTEACIILDKISAWGWDGRDIKTGLINWLICRTNDQIMEDAWEMVDEFDRLYNGGEIADECEEQLKVVIELLTALVNNKNKEYLCCETDDCDHIYGGRSDEYVDEDDNTFCGESNGEMHEHVHRVGEMREGAHREGEMHEGVHREGEMHDQIQGEGGIEDDTLSNLDKTYQKNINAPVQSINGGHPDGEKRTLSQITTPEGWKNQNPDEGNVMCGPDG